MRFCLNSVLQHDALKQIEEMLPVSLNEKLLSRDVEKFFFLHDEFLRLKQSNDYKTVAL